jgi:hypothetical protein
MDTRINVPVDRSIDNVSVQVYAKSSLEKLPAHTINVIARQESIKTR